MNISHLEHYRDLENWSKEDWENLNIHLFIAANFNRYCSILLKRIGMQYLPNDATEMLLGIFSDVSYRPLKSLHQRYLYLEGGRRNQVMLGSLKKIATTRVLHALIKEFPTHISLDNDRKYGDDETEVEEKEENESRFGYTPSFDSTMSKDSRAQFAAGSLGHETEHYPPDPRDVKKSLMLENLRAHLTSVQYTHLRYTICDGLDPHEIALKTGHSVTNVRIMLLNARKAMFKLVPTHLHSDIESCLYRRQPNKPATFPKSTAPNFSAPCA